MNIIPELGKYGQALTIANDLGKDANNIDIFKKSIAGLSEAHKIDIILKAQSAIGEEKLSRELLSGTIAENGLTAAIKKRTVAMQANNSAGATMGNYLRGFAASLMNPVNAILAGITVIIAAKGIYDYVKKKEEERRQEIIETAKATKEQSDSLSELIEKYKELRSASKIDGSTRSEIKNIESQIVDLVGKQGNGLDLVNGKLDKELQKLREINIEEAKKARDAAEEQFKQDKEDFNKGYKAPNSPNRSLISGVLSGAAGGDNLTRALIEAGVLKSKKSSQYSFEYASYVDLISNAKDEQEVLNRLNAFIEPVKNLGNRGKEGLKELRTFIKFYEDDISKMKQDEKNFIDTSINSSITSYLLSDNQKSFLERYVRDLDLTGEQITAYADKFNNDEIANIIEKLYSPDISNLSLSEQKKTIIDYINQIQTLLGDEVTKPSNTLTLALNFGFDIDTNKIRRELRERLSIGSIFTNEIMNSFTKDEIDTILNLNGDEFEKYFSGQTDSITKFRVAFDTYKKDWTSNNLWKYQAQVNKENKNAVDDLTEAQERYNKATTEAEKTSIKKEIDERLATWLEYINKISDPDLKTKSFESYQEEVDKSAASVAGLALRQYELSKSLSDAKDKMALLDSVQKEMDESGAISVATAQSLTEKGLGRLVSIDKETGAIKANVMALKLETAQYLENEIAKRKADITIRKTQNDGLKTSPQAAYIPDIESTIAENEKYIATTEVEIEFLESVKDVIYKKAEALQTEAEKLKAISDRIDTMQSAYVTINKAIEEYNKNHAVSIDTFQELMLTSPEYLDALDLENGKLIINKEKLQELIETQRRGALASIDAAEAKDIENFATGHMAELSPIARNALQDIIDKENDLTKASGNAAESLTKVAVATTMLIAAENSNDSNFVDNLLKGLGKIRGAYAEIRKNFGDVPVDYSLDSILGNKDKDNKSKDPSEDPYKKAFDDWLKTLKHAHAMGQISEAEYLRLLDAKNKEHFANKAKYLDEYRQYEEEVYSGNLKIRDSRLQNRLDIAKENKDYDEQIKLLEEIQNLATSDRQRYIDLGFKETDIEVRELDKSILKLKADIDGLRESQFNDRESIINTKIDYAIDQGDYEGQIALNEESTKLSWERIAFYIEQGCTALDEKVANEYKKINQNAENTRQIYEEQAEEFNKSLDKERDKFDTKFSRLEFHLSLTDDDDYAAKEALLSAEYDNRIAKGNLLVSQIKQLLDITDKNTISTEAYKNAVQEATEALRNNASETLNVMKVQKDLAQQQIADIEALQEKVVAVLKDKYQTELDSYQKEHDAQKQLLGDEKERLKERYDAETEAIDETLKALKKMWEAEDARKKKEKDYGDIEDIKKKMNSLRLAMASGDAVAISMYEDLEKQLKSKQEQLADDEEKERRKKIEESYSDQKDALKKEYDLNVKNIDNRIKLLEEEFKAVKEHYDLLLSNANLYAEAKKVMIRGISEEWEKALRDYEDKYGKGMGITGDYIKESISLLCDEVSKLLEKGLPEIVKKALEKIGGSNLGENLELEWQATDGITNNSTNDPELKKREAAKETYDTINKLSDENAATIKANADKITGTISQTGDKVNNNLKEVDITAQKTSASIDGIGTSIKNLDGKKATVEVNEVRTVTTIDNGSSGSSGKTSSPVIPVKSTGAGNGAPLQVTRYATGGFNEDAGLAFLDPKEQVLNAEQTSKFTKLVDYLDTDKYANLIDSLDMSSMFGTRTLVSQEGDNGAIGSLQSTNNVAIEVNMTGDITSEVYPKLVKKIDELKREIPDIVARDRAEKSNWLGYRAV